MNTTDVDEVLTLREAASVVKVGVTLLRRAIKRGTLRATNAGGRAGFRILRDDLMEWFRAGMPGTEPFTDDENEHEGDDE